MVNKVIVFLLVGMLGGSVGPCAAQQYAITDLGALPNSSSDATAVNRQGEAAGMSWGSGGTSAVAFRDGTVVALGNLGFADSRAFAINSAGDIVGSSGNGSAPRCCEHAFLYRGGTMLDLGTLGGDHSYAYGINDRLEIVGQAQLANGTYHAFLFKDGRMIDLGAFDRGSKASAINSLGQIIGSLTFEPTLNSLYTSVALFTINGFSDLGTFGGYSARADGINDAGQITGTRSIQEGLLAANRAFLYDMPTGRFRDLGTLGGGKDSFANALNSVGDVVGLAVDASFQSRAFLYSAGVMKDLNTLIPQASGWFLTSANSINDAGQIVGSGRFNGRDRAFLLSPLSSPGTTNLALNKPIYASSSFDATFTPDRAVDGSGLTRWSSAFSDPQWIFIDLGGRFSINRVVLRWETAYSSEYQLLVSDDAQSWRSVLNRSNSSADVDELALAAVGRYIGIYSTQRATPWGVSLFEFEVYGAPAVLRNLALNAPAEASSSYSSAFTPNFAVDGDLQTRWSSEFSDPQWIAIDLGSRQQIDHVVLRWEDGYSAEYQLLVSDDALIWRPVLTKNKNAADVDDLSVLEMARYVSIYSLRRGTEWGHSLWEFEVYGTP